MSRNQFSKQRPYVESQHGVTLVELLVGLAIGLLVIAVATGGMLISRGLSGTVSDASSIQQQGSYILRIIGQQLRQAGSLYLNPDPLNESATNVLAPVVFEIKAIPDADGGGNSFEQKDSISGDGESLTIGFMRYEDDAFISNNATNSTIGTDYLARNCLGGPSNTTDKKIESIFSLTGNDLRCAANGESSQPIAQNVAQFEVVYIEQSFGDGTTINYTPGSEMPTDKSDPRWRSVQGVQICFVLYGNESINLPEGSLYTDCNGEKIDMTTLDGNRKNRMHLLFRNTYQLRSQGLLNPGA